MVFKFVFVWLDKLKMDIVFLYEMKLWGVVDKCKEYWKNWFGFCKILLSL